MAAGNESNQNPRPQGRLTEEQRATIREHARARRQGKISREDMFRAIAHIPDVDLRVHHAAIRHELDAVANEPIAPGSGRWSWLLQLVGSAVVGALVVAAIFLVRGAAEMPPPTQVAVATTGRQPDAVVTQTPRAGETTLAGTAAPAETSVPAATLRTSRTEEAEAEATAGAEATQAAEATQTAEEATQAAEELTQTAEAEATQVAAEATQAAAEATQAAEEATQAAEEATPEVAPAPGIEISGRVVRFQGDTDEVEGTVLELSRSADDQQNWEPITRTVANSDGTFRLSADGGSEAAFYQMQIVPGSNRMVMHSIAVDSWQDWVPITDTLSGLVRSLTTSTAVTTEHISVTVKLSHVKLVQAQELEATYGGSATRRPLPLFYDSSTARKGGTVSPSVRVLGIREMTDTSHFSYLSCCDDGPEADGSVDSYFWSGYSSLDPFVPTVQLASGQASSLSRIYAPIGVEEDVAPPSTSSSGWTLDTTVVDGLLHYSSTSGANPLEWTIPSLEGFFELQAWVPRGSQALTYTVSVNGQPLYLQLGEDLQVSPGAASGFQTIGTFRLHDPQPVTVQALAEPVGVKAMLVRVVRLAD